MTYTINDIETWEVDSMLVEVHLDYITVPMKVTTSDGKEHYIHRYLDFDNEYIMVDELNDKLEDNN